VIEGTGPISNRKLELLTVSALFLLNLVMAITITFMLFFEDLFRERKKIALFLLALAVFNPLLQLNGFVISFSEVRRIPFHFISNLSIILL